MESLLGKCIHIEGPDFSGKSKLVKRLCDFFAEKGIEVDHRFQPGSTDLGKECRRLIFDMPFSKSMDLMAERMLFTVDHADFVFDVARNAKSKRSLIICDRYNPMSNLIYGHYGNGINMWQIKKLNDLAMRGVKPDLIILLDITEDTMISRMNKRLEANENINKLDLESLDFKRRILKGYKDILYFMKDHANIIREINANGTEEEVFDLALDVIYKRFDIKED
ncbi:MAG TPA: dTMP kinase [Defluviitaleaceae bacterium]|nr:dTMP kinase [Defluviitaleaceae bacterium]